MITFHACLTGLFVVFLAVGCASTAQFVPYADPTHTVQDPEKGRICVIQRPWLAINIASHTTPMSIRDGGTVIGITVGRAHLCWERQPGTTEISSSAYRSQSLLLTVEKGKVYYVLHQILPAWGTMWSPGGGEFTAKLELLDEKTGKKELITSERPSYRARP